MSKFKLKILTLVCVVFVGGLSIKTFANEITPTAITDLVLEGKIAFFDTSRGVFQLPLSANFVPKDIPAAISATIAFEDTIILTDSSRAVVGLVIYDSFGDKIYVDTFVGGGFEYAHSASYFEIGDFVMIKTTKPHVCLGMTLSECRATPQYISETQFSVR